MYEEGESQCMTDNEKLLLILKVQRAGRELLTAARHDFKFVLKEGEAQEDEKEPRRCDK